MTPSPRMDHAGNGPVDAAARYPIAMTTDDPTTEGFSLKRWSQRKLATARAAQAPALGGESATVHPAPPEIPAVVEPSAAAPVAAPALPPVESLTIDSDFTGYFQPKVDEHLKRQALKQLFRDPHFNVMDGLDVYIDDYSQPDPISPEIVRQMVQGRYIFDPPSTRVNDEGAVEDVPPGSSEAGLAVTETPSLPQGAPRQPAAPPGAQPEVLLRLEGALPQPAAPPGAQPEVLLRLEGALPQPATPPGARPEVLLPAPNMKSSGPPQ